MLAVAGRSAEAVATPAQVSGPQPLSRSAFGAVGQQGYVLRQTAGLFHYDCATPTLVRASAVSAVQPRSTAGGHSSAIRCVSRCFSHLPNARPRQPRSWIGTKRPQVQVLPPRAVLPQVISDLQQSMSNPSAAAPTVGGIKQVLVWALAATPVFARHHVRRHTFARCRSTSAQAPTTAPQRGKSVRLLPSGRPVDCSDLVQIKSDGENCPAVCGARSAPDLSLRLEATRQNP
jgi:hypothetical protein